MYFNVLRIVNVSKNKVRGTISFTAPNKWNVICFNQGIVELAAGDSMSLPVRISPDANATGGISYILTGTFRNDSYQQNANAYMVLPAVTQWDFATNSSQLYFTEFSPFAEFKVKLSNKGNTNELVKVALNIGKLLVFPKSNTREFTEFITLPAYKDTIITYSVTHQTGLNYLEKLRYENNWRESSIMIAASTDKTRKSGAVSIRKLNSTFENQRSQNASPLNIDYQTYNLMSNQAIRSNVRAYGSLLFTGNRELQYLVGVQNYDYGQTGIPLDLDQQLVYTMRYMDKHSNVEVGYNISGGNLHSINGRGINGEFRFGTSNTLSYTLLQNPFTNTYGEALGLDFMVKKLALSTGVINENSANGDYAATSVLAGTGFTLFKHHTFGVQAIGSQTKMNLVVGDTTVRGFSYKADYSMHYDKLSVRISGMSSYKNYIRNAGMEQIYMDGRYLMNRRISFSLYGNHQRYSSTRFPYNFYNPVSNNSTDYAKLTASMTSGRITYQLGPSYIGSSREFFELGSAYRSEYLTQQPGVWAAATVKVTNYSSITPNFTISNLRFRYRTQDPEAMNYTSNNGVSYSAGINYYDPHWRINAYYTSGSTSDLYRSLQVNDAPVITRTLQLRPSYENYFFNRTVKLSAYLNYIYYMPSGRENTSLNLRYDQNFKHGWTASVSGYMYSNVRVDEENGRISTKDINFLVGISKSFDFQQPRQKYYDVKAVFFNDLNGDRMKSENEPPVPNVKVEVEKDRAVSTEKSTIPSLELLSDLNGEIAITNLPRDNYILTMTPLTNLETLYFVDGTEQKYFNDKKKTIYIPLAESFKIRGRIIIERDVNSSEGKVDVNGVRITATSKNGATYSTLTDSYGAYVLSVPNADKYTVHINNVFGEVYNIDSNEQIVQFAENKTINLDFVFFEQKRGIVFDNASGYSYNFGAKGDEAGGANATASATPSKDYAIQIATSKVFTEPSLLKKKYKLKDEVTYTETDGVYRYFTGQYKDMQAARSAITKAKLPGRAVEVERALLKTAAAPIAAVAGGAIVAKENASGANVATGRALAAQPANSQPSPVAVTPKETKNTDKTRASLTKAKPTAIDPTVAGTPSVVKGAASASQTVPTTAPAVTVAEQPGNKASASPVQKPVEKLSQPQAANSSSADAKVAAVRVPAVPPASAEVKTETASEALPAKAGKALAAGNSAPKPAVVGTAAKTNNARREIVDGKVVDVAKEPVAVSPVAAKANVPVVQRVTPAAAKKEKWVQSGTVSGPEAEQNAVYTIRLDASDVFVEAKSLKEKYHLPYDVYMIEKDGTKQYFTGKFHSLEEAKADLVRFGITGFIVPYNEVFGITGR